MIRKVIVGLGGLLLVLGMTALVSNNVLGAWVPGLFAFVYVPSALFAFAAAMQGEESSIQFAKWSGVAYAILALLGGLVTAGLISDWSRINLVVSVYHAVLSIILLSLVYGRDTIWKWALHSRRVA
jgi:multidrug transporter EmrE-like cation transporter